MLLLKSGVRILGLKNEELLAVLVINSIFDSYGLDCIITAGMEGQHIGASLHYTGQALDFRSKHIPLGDKQGFLDKLRAALGIDFDVIFEAAGTDNEHFHVEFQPKIPY